MNERELKVMRKISETCITFEWMKFTFNWYLFFI